MVKIIFQGVKNKSKIIKANIKVAGPRGSPVPGRGCPMSLKRTGYEKFTSGSPRV